MSLINATGAHEQVTQPSIRGDEFSYNGRGRRKNGGDLESTKQGRQRGGHLDHIEAAIFIGLVLIFAAAGTWASAVS